MKFDLRQRLLASTFVGAAFVASPAWAQQDDQANQENAVSAVADPTNAPTEANSDSDDGEIVVTGSRIQRRDLVSSSPLAVVQDEEFKLSGAVNVEQVINTLPQVVPGATAFSNNPGGGVATLNLRGLGATRTLVLVNGRRYVFYDTSQVVDLNTIPQFLIDSVDVVTGGASAVYGSDALAGVVNFRLRNDLNGFEAGAQVNLTERGDGRRLGAHLALGSGFADDRGHVTVFGEYFERKPILQGGRSFSSSALGDDGDTLSPGGSATTPQGRISVAGTQVIAPVLAPGTVRGSGTGVVFAGFGGDQNNDGTISDAEAATALRRGAGNFGTAFGANFASPGVSDVFDFPGDLYNYAPANYLQVPQERFLLGGYGEFEISDAVTAFAEVSFVNNRVATELAATPVTGTFNVNIANSAGFLGAADLAALRQTDANEAAINAANVARCEANNAANAGVANFRPANCATAGALPGAGVVALSINRRVVETGSRNSLDERNAFRVLAGIKGAITEDFNYEAYYSYARTRNSNIQAGNVSRSAFAAGVLNGTINIFGPGTLTPAAVDSIGILAQNSDVSTLQVASASVNGSLFNFGMGAEDVGVAFGVEYRKVASRFIPDTALSSGDVIGFNGGDPTSGSYDVKDVFGEIRIPLISDRPFFNRLEVTGAARYSDYSLDAVGGVFTYAGGVEFSPIRDITFRGQYQRAVRAPNVGELFGGQSNGFPGATDPCSSRNTDNRTATVRQLCIQTGVPDALVFTAGVQPNSQIEGLFGGFAGLGEETSDSYTVGAVIRPGFIPRLNVTVDYFNIKVDDYISTFGGGLNNTLNLCYNQIQDINSVYCQAVRRDPANGQIGGQFAPLILNANVASLKTSGVDLQVDYSQPLGFGLLGDSSKLNFFFLGTYTEKNTFTPVVDQPDINTNCAGRFGQSVCGNPQPKYKWTSRLSLIDGPLTTSVRWRHLGKVRDDDDTTDYVVENLDDYDLVDLAFSIDATDAVSFSFGVNNLFDKKPQLIGDNQEQANTYPAVYDVLGRDYFISAALRF